MSPIPIHVVCTTLNGEPHYSAITVFNTGSRSQQDLYETAMNYAHRMGYEIPMSAFSTKEEAYLEIRRRNVNEKSMSRLSESV